MPLAASLPQEDIAFVVGFLLPIMLPRFDCDLLAAERLAVRLLDDYRPRNTRELHSAAEAIGLNLRCLTAMAQASDADISVETRDKALRTACQFSRQGQQVQRRFDVVARGPATAHQGVPASVPSPLDVDADANPQAAGAPSAVETPLSDAVPSILSDAPVDHSAGDPDLPDVATAETTYNRAQKLLELMKARWKGAPPPQTKAAQDIQQQQRITDMARMNLAQARIQRTNAVAGQENAA